MLSRPRFRGILGETLAVGAASAVAFLAGFVLLLTVFPPGVRPPGSRAAAPVSTAAGAAHGDSDAAGDPDTVGDARFQSGVPVICHHYLRANTTPRGFARILGALFLNLPLLGDMDVWTQTAAMFDAQMAYLKREGFTTVDLSDVVAWRRGLRALPARPIVITFDDGDRSVLEHALPILKKYGFKATLFVVTSKVGRRWDRVDCLGWKELRDLRDSGVFSIQSHSHDLHCKVKTSEGSLPVFVGARMGVCELPGAASWADGVCRDLRTSKELIERHVGNEVNCLAWPYGFGDAALDSVAVSAGYSVLCTLAEGTNWGAVTASHADRLVAGSWEVRRYTITARTSLRAFEDMIDAGQEQTIGW